MNEPSLDMIIRQAMQQNMPMRANAMDRGMSAGSTLGMGQIDHEVNKGADPNTEYRKMLEAGAAGNDAPPIDEKTLQLIQMLLSGRG